MGWIQALLEVCKDVSIAGSIGLMLVAGASYVSANEMVDNVRATAHDALALLQDEIERQMPLPSQSTTVVLVPGTDTGQQDDGPPPIPAAVLKARGELRNATATWARTVSWPPDEALFQLLDQDLEQAFATLGMKVQLNLTEMLPGYLDFPKAPANAVKWAGASAGAGLVAAVLDGAGKWAKARGK